MTHTLTYPNGKSEIVFNEPLYGGKQSWEEMMAPWTGLIRPPDADIRKAVTLNPGVKTQSRNASGTLEENQFPDTNALTLNVLRLHWSSGCGFSSIPITNSLLKPITRSPETPTGVLV